MENLNIENLKQILKELIEQLVQNKIDRKTAAKLVREHVNQSEIFSLDNSLISNSYWTIYGLNYTYCNTTNSELLYLKECFEGKREYSDEDKWEFVLKSNEPICNLRPSLKRQEISFDDYERLTPEKFEYFNNYMFGDKLTGCRLLMLLMADLGIETVVRLVDKSVWEEALKNYHEKG